MWRALQLARNGEGNVSPNPLVGAVIVHDNKIIGEGFHRKFGGPHAEVNAINSVPLNKKDLLRKSVIYVTLEPCAHYGKTPPCASLIVKTGIPEVIIGSLDPNPLVAGKGIKILEEAGIKAISGVLKKECDELNRRFFKAHTTDRPWILLKWAQSADGYMAAFSPDGTPHPIKFSNSLSSIWVHRHRASIDAIMVGKNTVKIDSPRLDVRLWGGRNPKKILIESHVEINSFVKALRKEGITSIIVEGGPTLLKSFLKFGLFDEIRIEISPVLLGNGLKAPTLPPEIYLFDSFASRRNLILTYRPTVAE